MCWKKRGQGNKYGCDKKIPYHSRDHAHMQRHPLRVRIRKTVGLMHIVTGFTLDAGVRDACQRVGAAASSCLDTASRCFVVHPNHWPPRVRLVSTATMGFGLAATTDIPAGTTIIVETRVALGKAADFEHVIPHDRVLHLPRKRVVADANPGPPGLWHVMNHSSVPTVVVRQLRGAQDAIVGIKAVTKKGVAAGEALTFDYGEPDPAWGSGAGGGGRCYGGTCIPFLGFLDDPIRFI